MGMALDEPADDDDRHQASGIEFLVGPRDSEYINRYGGLQIDYNEWGGFRVLTSSARQASC